MMNINDKQHIEALVANWYTQKNNLQLEKKAELALRIEICELLTSELEIGSHKFEFDNFKCKATKKITTSILPDELEAMYDDLSPEEADCISFKPSLSISKYKDLECSDVLDECLITKPAKPTLEVEYL